MTVLQRSAWYQLTIGLLAVLSYGILVLLADDRVAFAAFAWLGFTGLTPLLFPREVRDERDRLIARSALTVGWAMSHLFVVAACMLTWWSRFRLDEPMVAVSVLPLIAVGNWTVLLIARAAAVLVLERRDLAQEGP